MAIYELAKPIGGKAVEDLLKSFSGVPTTVATIIIIQFDSNFSLSTRMLLLSALEASLTLPECLLSICCMNSNSGCGRHSSLISSAYFMQLGMGQMSSSLSWTSGKPLYCLIVVWSLTQSRYREISTFGRGTIRKFATNSSEMKKLAARDFEDLLQVGNHVNLLLTQSINFITVRNTCF